MSEGQAKEESLKFIYGTDYMYLFKHMCTCNNKEALQNCLKSF